MSEKYKAENETIEKCLREALCVRSSEEEEMTSDCHLYAIQA